MRRVLTILTVNPNYVQFAIPELKSILSRLKIPLTTLLSQSSPLPDNHHQITHKHINNFPYVTLTIPQFRKYRSYFQNASRKTVLVSKFILLISEGSNYEELVQNRDQQLLKEQCRDWNQLVACEFISRNSKVSHPQKIQKINHVFSTMNVQGKVNLKNATKRLQLVEEYNDSALQKVYFGIQLSSSRAGKFNVQYLLNKRIYLGPTSTDNDLAFLMCNQANIRDGSLVFDPFVGTGGLLIPPASHGAYTFGCDLDLRVLNGYAVGRINKKSPFYEEDKQLQIFTPKIYLNFDQYGFTRPCIFRMDSTRPAFRSFRYFDAIISDPPYGRTTISKFTKETHPQSDPQTDKGELQIQTASRQIIFKGLLNIGKKYLRVGGRLVFLYPIEQQAFTVDDLPEHDDFRVMDVSRQVMSKSASRVLITLEKVVSHGE